MVYRVAGCEDLLVMRRHVVARGIVDVVSRRSFATFVRSAVVNVDTVNVEGEFVIIKR